MHYWNIIGYPNYSFSLGAFKEEVGITQLIGSDTALPVDTYQDGDSVFIIFLHIYPRSCTLVA